MKTGSLLEELRRRPLLCDGAMGTQLIARGLKPGECGETWNVDQPDHVRAIHRAYRGAGCDLITTNTFGGTSFTLARHNLQDRVAELNRAGAKVAREAAGDEAWVLGDIGPFGDFLEPAGDTFVEVAEAMFFDQASALHEGGADAIIIETMVDPGEVAAAVRAAKRVANWPVIATYAFNKTDTQFRTMMGTTVHDAMRAAIDAGADVVGANCGTSLSLADYARLAEAIFVAAGATPTILQPNAGSPHSIEGKLSHPGTPAEMAALVPTLLNIGLRIVGGCCGTSPAHLTAMRAAMNQR